MSPERAWWLRTLEVLVRPAPVFAALAVDDRDDLDARQEPLLAVTWLAGIAAALPTAAAQQMTDRADSVELAIWALLAGGFTAFVGYFVVGAAVYLGVRAVEGRASYRLARHVVGFAAVPLAVSLALWPVKLAVYGEDALGAGPTGFALLHAAFGLWALALLVVGLRALHRWTWLRAAGALVVVALVVVAYRLGRDLL